MNRTFIMLKPDIVQRSHIGEIIARFERSGFKIIAMKFMRISDELAARHYAEHVGKPFYEELLSYITSGPVVAIVVEGHDAVEMARLMLGATDPKNADIGTIRADFGQQLGKNVIHGSDSEESAKREISLFFREEELLEWKKIDEPWV
jgi:nucleoside-diphosphate kinase